MKILLLNDDGIYCEGLHVLYRSIKDFGQVLVLTPEEPKSAVGHGITLHKPLRINKYVINDLIMYGTNGTPSDSVHLAINVLGFHPDLIVSGVNVGDNTSIQNILYSGTLSAPIEGSLLNIPGIAFSADVSSCADFNNEKMKKTIKLIAHSIIKYINRHGFPKNADVLSINIPNINKLRKCIKLTKAAKVRFKQFVDKRIDPRGKPYYWLFGKAVSGQLNTDVYVVHEEGCISVTPLKIDFNIPSTCESTEITEMLKFAEEYVKHLEFT